MKRAQLSDMLRGWFIGDFSPTVLSTKDVEVGVKLYKAGDSEERHFHKIATEVTVILSGRVRMNGVVFVSGDIITIDPMESSNFEALEDTSTVVVKLPGAKNDKYLGVPRL